MHHIALADDIKKITAINKRIVVIGRLQREWPPMPLLLFAVGKISGGTALTLRMAQQNHKSYLHIDLKSVPEENAVLLIQEWLGREKPGILNIAGSREWSPPYLWPLT